MAIPLCQLCREEKKLIKAHIIPEFMYQDSYEDGKMLEFLGIDLKDADEGKVKYRRKGIYDNSILCKDCDNGILNVFDNYAARVLYGYEKSNITIKFYKQEDGLEYRVGKPVDYSLFNT